MFGWSGICNSANVEKIAFSQNEKENFEFIFNYLFKFETFSYTLLSDKPISFAELNKAKTDHLNLFGYAALFSYNKPINFLQKKWIYWKNKSEKLNLTNYYLFDKESEYFTTVILINKLAFSKTFKENENLFRIVLGGDITEEKVLSKILSDRYSLKQAVNNHEGLFGILLGFGTNNSLLFHEKQKLLKEKSLFIDSSLSKDRLSEINKVLKPSHSLFNWITVVQPVRFLADKNSIETKLLLKKYDTDSLKISKMFSQSNFVDLIINKLSE